MSEEKKDRISRTMVGEVDVKKSQTTAHQTGRLPNAGEESGSKEQSGNVSQNQPTPAANDKGESKS